MNNFMSEVGSSLEAIPNVEKKANSLVSEAENKKFESAAQGCSFGRVTSLAGCTTMASTLSTGNLMLIIFLPPLIGYGVGTLLDKGNKKALDQKVERAVIEAERMKAEAEQNFRNKLQAFMASNTL